MRVGRSIGPAIALIEAEAVVRAAADSALSTEIDTDVGAEATARGVAVAAEATARGVAIAAEATARDGAISDHGDVEAAHHTKFTTTEHDVVARHPLANLNSAVCSETEAAALIVAGDVDKVDGYDAIDLTPRLTVLLFQANAGTGTANIPARINDTDIGNHSECNAIDKYYEVDFGQLLAIKQYRQYGTTTNNGDGVWKIQYWDGDSWEDWETGIATSAIEGWSGWVEPAAGVKLTTKIRLVCTTVDTAAQSRIVELEIKY